MKTLNVNQEGKFMMKEYGIRFTSNDGSETHITGHYSAKERAEEAAKKHIANGNKNVFIVEREVTEWKVSK